MGDGFDGNLVLFLVRALMLPTVALLIGFLFDGGRMGGIVGVQLVCVATFALALCVAYYVIASDAPIAFSSANGLEGVVSLYEARYVNILCVLGLSVQLFVVCFENMYQSAKMAVGGVLAVVAEEVRKLAEQSEQAAQEISAVIGKNSAQIENAFTLTKSQDEEVKESVEEVRAADEKFAKIAESIRALIGQVAKVGTITGALEKDCKSTVDTVQKVSDLSHAVQQKATEANLRSAARSRHAR